MTVSSVPSYKKRKYPSHRQRLFHICGFYGGTALVICSMLLLLSACTLFPGPTRTGVSGNDTDPGITDTTPTQAPSPTQQRALTTITLQVVDCPTLSVSWDKLVGAKSGVNKVQKAACGTFEGGGEAALVNVRYYADAKLDVYVYDNLGGTPAKRFSLTGLARGDTQISPSGTIMTAENPDNDPLGPSVFKEYQWDGAEFGQILFPGIFPYTTHYQAEQAQAAIAQQETKATATPTNASIWQLSAYSVVNRLAQNVFHWPSDAIKNSIVQYNATKAVYVIQCTNIGPGGGGFIATLFHLDGNLPSSLFEIQEVSSVDGTTLLNSPANDSTDPLSSPVKVSASYQSSGTILGRVAVYSDTLQVVGDTGAIHGSASTGFATFSPSVKYKLSGHGKQEGVIAFYATNQNNISISNQIVVSKVFLNA